MLGKTNGGGGGFDPSEIQSGTIAVDNILGLDALGDIVKGNLAGQYVRVIPAPASTTLTDDEYNAIKEGVFINGTLLGIKNPILFPFGAYNGNDYGVAIGCPSVGDQGKYTYIKAYAISSAKVISVTSADFSIENTTGAVSIGNLSIPYSLKIKDKNFPNYPTSNTTTKFLQIGKYGGNLSWGDVPSPAVVAYEGTSLLPTDVVFEDWTLHRAIKDGNVLWVVICGAVTNTSINQVSVTNLFSIDLPADIASKIYRFDGTTCDNSYLNNDLVLIQSGTINESGKNYKIVSQTANNFVLTITSAETLNSQATKIFNVRIPIFLNIGD